MGTEVEVQPNDYLENLDMAIMISGEARKDRWALFTDFIYLDFSAEGSKVKVGRSRRQPRQQRHESHDHSTLTGVVWTLGAGYAVLQGRPVDLDVFGGLRYFGLEASTDWQRRPDSHRPERGANRCAIRQRLGERGSLGWDRRRQGALPARPKQLVDPLLLRHGNRLVESDMAGDARH